MALDLGFFYELSTQEEDLLDRSTKKPKVVGEVEQAPTVTEKTHEVVPPFQTTIGLGLEKFDASGDLNKLLISKFSLEGRVYYVEYEGLHLVCFHCGLYGHKKEGCPLLIQHISIDPGEEVLPHSNDQARSVANTTVVQPPVDDNSYGPWMLVQKSSRG
ncbi:Zinc finger, CCHC-type [Sesbania bispinosa]|nr:Zinc finger, CCHC-type [Sesbania bispinosa]